MTKTTGTWGETLATIEAQAQAQESAALLLSQGWTERGALYDVGMYHGDAEALAERLGRETTRDERVVLERKIRECLDAAYKGAA